MANVFNSGEVKNDYDFFYNMHNMQYAVKLKFSEEHTRSNEIIIISRIHITVSTGDP